jgi:hypothetical protein
MFHKVPQYAIKASFEQNVEGNAEIAIPDKLGQLQEAAVFQSHGAVL